MLQEIIIAGFGGQGVLSMGQLLTYAGMLEGKHVAWYPSYGPEMRGGTANCGVTVSDKEISCPLVSEPTTAIVMNRPSLDKFEPTVKPDGLLLVNGCRILMDLTDPLQSLLSAPSTKQTRLRPRPAVAIEYAARQLRVWYR